MLSRVPMPSMGYLDLPRDSGKHASNLYPALPVPYLLRRFGFYLLAGWVSISLNFIIPRLMPGDPASALMARFRGQISSEALDALRNLFGVNNEPLIQQYFKYLAQLSQGQLGLSLAHFPAPVEQVIGTGIVWTLLVSGCAVLVSFTIGSSLGVLTAWWRGGKLDAWLPPALIFLGAFPYFWLAMFGLYAFGYSLNWLPVRHAYSDGLVPELSLEFMGSVALHAVLPVCAVVLATLGGWLLSMRSSMVAVLSEDYIALGRAKGLSEVRVMLRYAARNALLPNVTAFGMALGFVLSGALLTEIVFSYPGLGYLLIEAVQNQDYPLIQGLFLCITLAVLAANAAVDVVYVWLDPRARS